jgi:NAD-dependent deacetylase
LAKVAELAARANRIAVLTGAGVSAESGVPTFRDAHSGLWSKYDPVMLASIDGFMADPATVWRWYDERRQNLSVLAPNQGHFALAEWQRMWQDLGRSFNLSTQNIDDLHNLAGSANVLELHGNIWQVRPVDAPHGAARWLRDCPLGEIPPRDEQGSLLRPHVVWFGEMLGEELLADAASHAGRCDLFLSIGTSSMVFPAAGLPFLALERGATVVEINPARTDFSASASYVLRGTSASVLPELLKQLRQHLDLA